MDRRHKVTSEVQNAKNVEKQGARTQENQEMES